MRLARPYADARGDDHIHSGHLLLAILDLNAGPAARVLDAAGVDRDLVRDKLEAGLPPSSGNGDSTRKALPISPGCRAALEAAAAASKQTGAKRVSEAHLLTGLLVESVRAREALVAAGVDLTDLKRRLEADATGA